VRTSAPPTALCVASPTLRAVTLAVALAAVGGCSAAAGRSAGGQDITAYHSATELAESQLLDVWIETFDPGSLPDGDAGVGLTMDIREAESRYMPVELRSTMEKTGYWGAVRTVPRGTEGAEVLVTGTIVESDGEKLVLVITAFDGRGVKWFSSRYSYKVSLDEYRKRKPGSGELFAPLYNSIANDLAAHRAGLSHEEVVEIRRLAELRFALDLAPDAFRGHIMESTNGRYAVVRLPAEDDPMYARVRAIRERDFLLVDSLSDRINAFHREMRQPYNEWRKARAAEAESLRKIERAAIGQKALGILAIGAAIGMEVAGVGGGSTLNSVLIVGGAYAVKKGFDMDSETTIHREAIEELGYSFSTEARPLVVEIEGETHELTGSAEVQYAKWRELLRQIYASETGLTEAAVVN
jgi:hypothetical protein